MMTFSVIYKDDALLAVDKPAGIPVLSDGWEKHSNSIFKLVTEEFGKVFLVHRLDKQTSGVIIFARTPESQRNLSSQFEKREVKKTYLAILVGEVVWHEMICNLPLRVNTGRNHRTVVDRLNGKPAETFFRVKDKYPHYTLMEAIPKSGRTHQIRAHALALGYPIVGDSMYQAPNEELIRRPALHAEEIIFSHPVNGKMLSLFAPLPPDFLEAIGKIKSQL